MKLHAAILFFAAVMQASSQSSITIETAPPSVWITPLDLSLGLPAALTADQIFGSVFTLRSEVHHLTSIQGRSYVNYRWFVRNELDRALSVAVVRSQPPPINPQGLGHVYGAIWASTGFSSPLSTKSLYGVRMKNAVGWRRPEDRPPANSPYIQWLPLQPKQEREIHWTHVPASEAIEAAVFSIPFRIDELLGEGFLYSTIP